MIIKNQNVTIETLNPVFSVVLPWPPSINAMYRSGRGNRYMTDKAAAWFDVALLTIVWAPGYKKYLYPEGSKVLMSHALVPPGAHNLDLDNRDKPLGDALEKSKLIANDVQIFAGDRIKYEKQPGGRYAGVYLWVSRLPGNFGVTFDPENPMKGV